MPFVGEVNNAKRLTSEDVVAKFPEKSDKQLPEYAKRLYADIWPFKNSFFPDEDYGEVIGKMLMLRVHIFE